MESCYLQTGQEQRIEPSTTSDIRDRGQETASPGIHCIKENCHL